MNSLNYKRSWSKEGHLYLPQYEKISPHRKRTLPKCGYSFVVSSHAGSANANTSVTAGMDTTGADILVVLCATYNPTGTPVVTDSKGNTWNSFVVISPTTAIRLSLFYSIPSSVGAAHISTVTLTGSFPSSVFAAFSGAKQTSPNDQSNGTNGSSTSGATGSITPSENNELIISGVGLDTPATNSPNSSSLTVTDRQTYTAGQNFGCALSYGIQTTATSINETWSWVTSTSFTVLIGSFKAIGGAGTVPFQNLMLLGVGTANN